MKIINCSVALALTVSLVCVSPYAQNPAGGPYLLERSVVANGGNSSSGGSFQMIGTAAQSAAGTTSTGSPFSVRGGFWHASLAPTAASVSISGRVVASPGISSSQVILTDTSGGSRSTFTSAFGYYRFDDVEVGQLYIISVQHKNFTFADNPRALQIQDELSDVDFFAIGVQ